MQEFFGTQKVALETEAEFKYLFPDCEVGAMPFFGNFYDMEVYVVETLTDDKGIAFNAGTHTEMIKLSYEDFEQLVKIPEFFNSRRKQFLFLTIWKRGEDYLNKKPSSLKT